MARKLCRNCLIFHRNRLPYCDDCERMASKAASLAFIISTACQILWRWL
jgi:hypothetical protein